MVVSCRQTEANYNSDAYMQSYLLRKFLMSCKSERQPELRPQVLADARSKAIVDPVRKNPNLYGNGLIRRSNQSERMDFKLCFNQMAFRGNRVLGSGPTSRSQSDRGP